ncbi:hypothetical protein J2129_000579 [Methanofollis sp. W23]|uniref:hypothetical protein n=1 Tax=Methanofollis sp. W23 TaxID=2817849 RepID=UPI001AEB075B|nr:hypothetical protein [Methanofollis sp. W23]MBP2145125.1 hypothetical protein [Methanofollis sp. W23]
MRADTLPQTSQTPLNEPDHPTATVSSAPGITMPPNHGAREPADQDGHTILTRLTIMNMCHLGGIWITALDRGQVCRK